MAKTASLPGMEDPKNQAIIDAAEAYEKSRNKRMKALAQEVEDNARLVELLKDNKLKQYRGPEGLFVTLSKAEAKVKAKVRRVGDSEDGGEEE